MRSINDKLLVPHSQSSFAPAMKTPTRLLVFLVSCLAQPLLLAAESPTPAEAEDDLKMERASAWAGQYRGIGTVIPSGDSVPAEYPPEIVLEIGWRSIENGQVQVNRLRIDENTLGDLQSVFVSLSMISSRWDKFVIDEDRLYIPPSLANPVELELVRTQGEFDEEIIEGTVKVYAPKLDKPAEVMETFRFKVARP